MNSEWFFLKEAHSLSGLPNDNIPEYIFWEDLMLESHRYKPFNKKT